MNQSPEMKEKSDKLLAELLPRVVDGIRKKDATEHMAWLSEQPIEVIRDALVSTQPYGWRVPAVKLVESLDDQQAIGMLGAQVAIFATAQALAREQR